MSRNGSGVYSLPAGNPVVTGTTISSSWANTTLSDIATALTGSVAADGQTAMTGNLQMGNNKITGLANGSASTDALAFGQIAAGTMAGSFTTLTASSTATLNTLSSSGATITGGSINGTTVGATTPNTGAFTSLSASGAFAANGGATLGDASGDALTINSSAVSIPNGLNFDSNTLVIDAANNNVGIGTSSPASQLDVSKTGDATLSLTSSGVQRYQLIARSGGNFDIYDQSSAASRITLTQAGNVGIGTSSPLVRLHVSTTGTSTSAFGNVISTFRSEASGRDASIQFSDGTNTGNIGQLSGNLILGTGGTERMRIDSSGNLLVGTTNTTGIAGGGSTNPGVWLAQGLIATQNNGDANIYCSKATGYTSSNYIAFWVSGTLVGSITTNGSVTLYNTTSDYRLKNIVGNISDSGQRIDALEPIEYDWKNGGRTRGFLAHKFAEVYPNSVNGEKDAVDKDGKPVYQAMQASTPEVMADLIAEIQSLRKRVATLESK